VVDFDRSSGIGALVPERAVPVTETNTLYDLPFTNGRPQNNRGWSSKYGLQGAGAWIAPDEDCDRHALTRFLSSCDVQDVWIAITLQIRRGDVSSVVIDGDRLNWRRLRTSRRRIGDVRATRAAAKEKHSNQEDTKPCHPSLTD